MAYIRKTVDRWDIETNYGYGWEVEDCEYTRAEAMKRLKEYRENVSGLVRLVKRREKKQKSSSECKAVYFRPFRAVRV